MHNLILFPRLVAGDVDTIEILQGRNIDDVIDKIKSQAIEKAINFGANPSMPFFVSSLFYHQS